MDSDVLISELSEFVFDKIINMDIRIRIRIRFNVNVKWMHPHSIFNFLSIRFQIRIGQKCGLCNTIHIRVEQSTHEIF
jgi:hypothetical protein